MEKLKENLWEELEKLDRKQELNPGDLELAHKLTDTIKNIDKICMLEDEEDGYSGDGEWAADMRGTYGRGSSHAGRKMRNGGYSSRRRDGRGRYSREGGRSEMMEHIEMAMDAATPEDRETIKRFMRQLENA